jgi:hypothetical protein
MRLNYNHVQTIVNRHNIYQLYYDDYKEETMKIILYFDSRDSHGYNEIQEMIIHLFFEEDVTDDQIKNCHFIANDLYTIYEL